MFFYDSNLTPVIFSFLFFLILTIQKSTVLQCIQFVDKLIYFMIYDSFEVDFFICFLNGYVTNIEIGINL